MYSDSVCLVGYSERQWKRKTMEERLVSVLDFLTENGYTEFYLGGSNDWETICAAAIINLKKTHSDIHLNYVLPYAREIYTTKWSKTRRRVFLKLLEEADSVEYVSKDPIGHSLAKRDDRLVELGDVCVCYYDERLGNRAMKSIMKKIYDKGIYVFNVFEKGIN